MKVQLRQSRARKIERISEEKDAATGGETDVSISDDDVAAGARFLAGLHLFQQMLRPASGPLEDCVLHLYTFDDSSGLLVPVYEPDDVAAPAPWKPGIGVTGQAYVREELVRADGPDTHNGTFGVRPEERGRHADLLEVAALPVVNASGRMIAVLAASNRVRRGVLGSSAGEEELVATAEAVARILIDLLDAFDDN